MVKIRRKETPESSPESSPEITKKKKPVEKKAEQKKKPVEKTPPKKSIDPKDLPIGQQVPIKGKVLLVEKTKCYKGKNVTVYAPKSQLTIKTVFYPPIVFNRYGNYVDTYDVETGDAIIGDAIHRGGGLYEFIKPPLIEISVDKESIIKCIETMVKNTKFRESNARKLYEKMSSLAEGEETSDVINLFNDLSVQYIKLDLDIEYSNDNNISPKYIEQGQFLALLGTWHQKRIVRQLYLLGLTDDEMSTACYLHDIELEKLYERARDNPNSICNLSVEKIEDIMKKTKRYPNVEQNRCGIIIRTLYDYLDKRKYNCVSSYTLNKIDKDWKKFLKVKRIKKGDEEKDDPEYEYVNVLEKEYDLIYDSDREVNYIRKVYIIETSLSNDFRTLVKNDPLVKYYELHQKFPEVNEKGEIIIDNKLYKYDREEVIIENTQLITEQRLSIQGVIDHNLSIITGGAGVGKTTVIQAIVNSLIHRNQEFYLCSFTGKAVVRIKKAVPGVPAYTIHRLIPHIKKLGKEGNIPSHLIIDEASMVSMPLIYDLIKTIKHIYGDNNLPKFTFIGDNNQLQPIDWGNIFKGMIDSNAIPTYVLLHNHRVDEDPQDGIVINASSMINNLYNKKDETPDKFNFAFAFNFVMNYSVIDVLYAYIETIYEDGVLKEDFKILSPYVKDLETINRKVQDIYLFDRKFVQDSRGKKWYMDDLVIMCHNNYDIDVMNGEEGVVIKISDKVISVKFGENKIADFALEPPKKSKRIDKRFTYALSSYENEIEGDLLSVLHLKHSYAISVHASQGSEWPRIIFWIPQDIKIYNSFLNCNLIYTAITRARKSFIALGNTDALIEGTRYSAPYRNDKFTDRMKKDMLKIELISKKDQDIDINKLPKMFLSEAERYGFDDDDNDVC